MIFYKKTKRLLVAIFWITIVGLSFLPKGLQAQKLSEEVSANEVMDLYLKTMLNANEESRKQLNHYLRPLYKGKDAFARPIHFFESLIEDSQKSFLLQIDEEIAKKIKPTLKSYYTTLFSLAKDTQCTIIKTEEKENLVQVNYQCKYIVPKQKELLQQDVSKLSFKQLNQVLQKLQKDMALSKNFHQFNALFDLYIIKQKGKTYYFNNQPATLPLTLIDKFISDLEK